MSLSATTLRGVVDAALTCAEIVDVADFPQAVNEALRQLVGCDIYSFNDLDLAAGTARLVCDPPLPLKDAEAILGTYALDNPLVVRSARSGGAMRPARISDFLSTSTWTGTALYTELFRPSGIRHQVAVVVSSDQHHAMAFALNREGQDFDDRDCAVLELLLGHIRLAHDRAVLIGGLAATADGEVVVLDRSGRVVWATERARAVLITALDWHAEPGSRLPAPLASRVEAQRAALEGHEVEVPNRLAVGVPGSSARVQWFPGPDGSLVLAVRPDDRDVTTPALRRRGLTPRQSEVVLAVADGLTNHQIATQLGISEGTVERHIADAYRRLDIHSRVQATKIVADCRGEWR